MLNVSRIKIGFLSQQQQSSKMPQLRKFNDSTDQVSFQGFKNNDISFGSGFGIKVCGVCDEASVGAIMSAAYAAKTDKLIIGVLIGITHAAKDKVSDSQAADIIKKIRETSYNLDRPVKIACVNHCTDSKTLIAHIEKISEMALEGRNGLKAIAKKVNGTFGTDTSKLTLPIFDLIQIHDNMPIEEISIVKQKYPKCKILKTVHVPKKEEKGSYDLNDLINKAIEYAKSDSIDGLLLDSSNLSTNQIGGTGLVNDWQVAKKIITAVHKKTGKPVALAGGLNPENAKAAIKATGADMIDGNTGWRHDRKGEIWRPLDPKKSAPKDPFAVYWVLKEFGTKVSKPFVNHFDKE